MSATPASSPLREAHPSPSAAEAPLSEDLFEYIASKWLLTEEIVIHRRYGKLTIPWMSLILHTPSHNPYWSIFCVSQASCPFPRMPAMIIKHGPGQLVMKGQMIYETQDKPEDFILTFTSNPSKEDPIVWWNGLLQIAGYPSVQLYILFKGNSMPERGFCAFKFGDKRLRVNDPVLYQSNNGLSAIGTFQAWKAVPGTKKKQLKITIGNRDYSPSVNLCLMVVTSKPKNRSLPPKDGDQIPYYLDLVDETADADATLGQTSEAGQAAEALACHAADASSPSPRAPDPMSEFSITIEESECVLCTELLA